jgi:hypothetical protein
LLEFPPAGFLPISLSRTRNLVPRDNTIHWIDAQHSIPHNQHVEIFNLNLGNEYIPGWLHTFLIVCMNNPNSPTKEYKFCLEELSFHQPKTSALWFSLLAPPALVPAVQLAEILICNSRYEYLPMDFRSMGYHCMHNIPRIPGLQKLVNQGMNARIQNRSRFQLLLFGVLMMGIGIGVRG